MKSEIILQSFLKYAKYINLPDDPLVNVQYADGKPYFKSLSVKGFIRLFCCAYLEKNDSFYKHLYPDVSVLFEAIKSMSASHTISPSMKGLLEWLQIDAATMLSISDISQLTDFTRRICYFNTGGSTIIFKSILPSDKALSLHITGFPL